MAQNGGDLAVEKEYQNLLQEISAASDFDDTLNIIVRRIKNAVPLDACAIYLVDVEAEQHVLMASSGMDLRPGAPLRSDRRSGLLGLVDDRQELVTLTHASSHPQFRRFPSTEVSRFESFVGIPLIHLRRIRGILVGWKKVPEGFAPKELTFIVTVAAQLASIIHDATAADEIEHLLKGDARERDFIEGVQAAPGLAVGVATVLLPSAMSRCISGALTSNIETEEGAFRAAVADAYRELEASERQLAGSLTGEARELFEVHLLLLKDEGLLQDAVGRIRAGSRSAIAWREAIKHHVSLFERMEDAYLRARADDILEVGERVLGHLEPVSEECPIYPERCILVADRVGITDIAAVPTGRLAGIVCRHGSALSHAAVLAHALGIPAVVQLASLPAGLIEGCTMAVDGDLGRVYVNPSSKAVDGLQRSIEERRVQAEDLAALRELPARTPDGVSVSLHANVGLPSDTDAAVTNGAEGVGLYRTEYQFLLHEGFPIEEEQYVSYLSVLKAFAPRRVTIRTLDVGGDKILSYFPVAEDNPFLGCRGIRFSLSHPEIFQIQLRALLRANAVYGNLQILFPMIARVSEFDSALHLLERSHHELGREGKASTMPRLGVMIEVPSAVFLTKTLADRVDFLSIGSNDLAQYVLAADRTNAEVATIDDTLHPAVAQAIHRVVVQAHEREKPVTVCGEMAGDEAGALLSLGLGVDTLSMSPPALAPVKRVIRSFSFKEARALAKQSLELEDGCEVRQLLDRALRNAGMLAIKHSLTRSGDKAYRSHADATVELRTEA